METKNVNNKVTLLTLGIFSITSLLLSFMLSAIPDIGFRQGVAILMLFVTATTLVIIHKHRMFLHNSFNFWSFKAWLILGSIVIILFITVNNDIIITLNPNLVNSFYFFALFFSSTQILFFLDAILYTKIKRWANRSIRRRFELTNGGECYQSEVDQKVALDDKERIATALTFHSITKKYVSPSAPIVLCPHCSFLIDFNQRVEWLGPSALICGYCGEVVDLIDILDDL